MAAAAFSPSTQFSTKRAYESLIESLARGKKCFSHFAAGVEIDTGGACYLKYLEIRG
jgi:hypothetical protein